jgi:hypothetical protein
MSPISDTVPPMAHQVDPRDVEWEVESPNYRVYFWQHRDGTWVSDEFELDVGDVTEAICWAEENSAGRDYVLYAVIPAEGGRVGLVRLNGSDPTVPRDCRLQ